ncbi:helix-turn-helix domain-containing protein [Yanghanlia caeni]|uniref:helix-turn-helix domain-containing protein n=1 Tax=Yanghanlia caeni TaxID=3064283 RepID=UPI003D2FF977
MRSIRSLRERYQLSQSVLASLLNTSISAVQQWESGEKRPGGPSQRLLDILERKGLEAFV